jgi:NAD(P)-dependent dehydrogenase (short-subunit alcohol dehydrogenase family)
LLNVWLIDCNRLVNNAGISIEAGQKALKIHETPEQWWDLTMSVNTKSVFLATKYVVGQMLRQDKLTSGDRGWIINISSIFGLVGGKTIRKSIILQFLLLLRNPCGENYKLIQYIACYAASKGAVANLTRQVAMDYAEDGIHCNAICPGCK